MLIRAIYSLITSSCLFLLRLPKDDFRNLKGLAKSRGLSYSYMAELIISGYFHIYLKNATVLDNSIIITEEQDPEKITAFIPPSDKFPFTKL